MLLVAVLLLLGGCRVDTRVSIVEHGGGQGTVSVSAVFDAAAVQALGGESGLAGQLSVADLRAAGWAVSGPVMVPGGGAAVTVSHDYSSSAEAKRLLAEVAGSGTTARRPFQLNLSTRSGFFHEREILSGRIDLRCGLSCFGDQGLQSALGNGNGVVAAPLLNGQQPAEVFGFSFSARMPGSLQSDNAVSRNRSGLTWTTPLGQVTEISASSETLNTGNIVWVAVLGGLAIVGLGLLLFFWRRRRRGRGLGGDPGGGAGRGAGRGKHVRRRRIWPFGKPTEAAPADDKETVAPG